MTTPVVTTKSSIRRDAAKWTPASGALGGNGQKSCGVRGQGSQVREYRRLRGWRRGEAGRAAGCAWSGGSGSRSTGG